MRLMLCMGYIIWHWYYTMVSTLGWKLPAKYFKLTYNLEQYVINEWCKELRIKLKHGQGEPKLIDRVIERTPIVPNISLVGPIGSPFVLTILSVLLSCPSSSLHFLVASFPCFCYSSPFHNACVRLLYCMWMACYPTFWLGCPQIGTS